MYTYVLELRFVPAAYHKGIPYFSNNSSFLYDFCITFVYSYTIHIKE